MNESTPQDEVASRVRRTVGLKVLRDTSNLAQDQQEADRQRPGLLLRLLLLLVVVAALTAALVHWL